LKITTWQHLEEFAKVGLRTLLIAKRNIPSEMFKEWNQKYLKACAAIENREELMETLQSEIEDDLELLGGTGIEDKLQDDVAITIHDI
jgi:magnesium-transporting ATPase (P-type)